MSITSFRLLNCLKIINVLGVLAMTHHAQGEIRGTDSVEWMTCASSVVIVGKVKNVTSTKGPGDVVYDDCTVEVSETIKGKPAKEVTFSYRHLGHAENDWKAPRKNLLVFLSVWQDDYTDKQARLLTEPDYETRMHKRLVPSRDHSPFSILILTDLPKTLFDKEMRRVTDRNELLGLCRQWAASGVTQSVRENAPLDSDVFKQLFGGSAVFLAVPAEEKYRQRFLKLAQSPNANERANAARELWKFPGAESETALRLLLEDKTENIWFFANDTIDRIEYGVRSAAYRSLQQLGKPVPQIPLQREPSPDERRKYRHDAWRKSFREALQDGWKLDDIRDAEVTTKEHREWTVVEIDLSKNNDRTTLRLVPKEFGKDNARKGVYLGIDGPDNQGGRHFYGDSDIPELLKQRLISYFGLVLPTNR